MDDVFWINRALLFLGQVKNKIFIVSEKCWRQLNFIVNMITASALRLKHLAGFIGGEAAPETQPCWPKNSQQSL